MKDLDRVLREYFSPASAPADLAVRPVVRRNSRPAPRDRPRFRRDRPRSPRDRPRSPLDADRFRIDATDRGVSRLLPGRDGDARSAAARRIAGRAREELREYFAGQRAFFSVPVDLAGVPDFQGRVLREALRIPFGEIESYAALARRIDHPRAARAVGNALGANPVPIIVPCHRVVRDDGTWGHYAFGGAMKTALLDLERSNPLLIGCTTTRIVCLRGCRHEQRLREDRRVAFASLDDAAGNGYRQCRTCRPDAALSKRPA
jgi:O-6-methylguanine DNA methyltransferase